jgi:hypothetical protein
MDADADDGFAPIRIRAPFIAARIAHASQSAVVAGLYCSEVLPISDSFHGGRGLRSASN